MAKFISPSLILYLFLEAERHPGTRVAKRWWDQPGMRLAGSRGDKEMDTEGTSESEGTEEYGIQDTTG